MKYRLWPLLLSVALIAAACGTASVAAVEPSATEFDVAERVEAATTTTTLPPITTTTTTSTAPTTTVPENPACSSAPRLAESTPPEATALTDRIAEALAHPGFADVEVGLSVWVEGLGEIAVHQPDLQLEPASNQKILVALAANSMFELDERLTTSFERVGTDLVIRAAADPSISLGRLHAALDVVATTNTSFDRLVLDVSAFPQAPRAAGWEDWQIPRYVGPLSSFMIDNNRWTGSDAMVTNPDRVNSELIIALLGDRGVQVDSLEIASDAPEVGELITTIESPPIGDLVQTMLLSSDNQHADLLLMELGRRDAEIGTLANGAAAINSALEARCAQVEGDIDDGSGLSRDNQRSARAFVDALVSLHDTPEGELLRSQLPVGGVSGTLASRFGGSSSGRVQAKTGTIIGGRSLTGWGTMSDGSDAIFSLIVNGEPEAAHASLGAMDALVSLIISN